MMMNENDEVKFFIGVSLYNRLALSNLESVCSFYKVCSQLRLFKAKIEPHIHMHDIGI